MTGELHILTPEKTVVSWRTAGLGSRIGAFLIDVLLLYIIMTGLTVIGVFVDLASGGLGSYFIMAIAGFTPFIYFTLFEGLGGGQTLGKRALGLKTIMADGTPVTTGAALLRSILLIADLLPGLPLVAIGFMITNEKSQRFGDLVAGTVVIRNKPLNYGYTPSPHRSGVHHYESAIGDVDLVTIEEYRALKMLCDRFPQLTRETQIHSLKRIWEPIAQKCRVQPIDGVHPIYLAEAAVMKYGRVNKLI